MIAVSWGPSNVMRTGSALFLVTCAAWLSAAPASAAPPKGASKTSKTAPAAPTVPDDVDSMESLFQKLEYEQANAAAQAVLKRHGLSHDELVRTYRVLAVTYAILDKEDLAKETFIKLLAVDPSYEVDPNLGPRVGDPFLEARGYFRQQGQKPGLTVDPKVRTDGGVIRVQAKGPPRLVKHVQVGWRWGSSGAMTESHVPSSEGSVEIAKAPAGATRLDYFVLALDENDNAVMSKGSKDAPVSVFAEATPKGGTAAVGGEKEGRSIFASPWFWIVTGVVVAGGAVTGYYVLGPARVDAPTSVTVRPTLQCGQSACN
jgi:hypothetical protein